MMTDDHARELKAHIDAAMREVAALATELGRAGYAVHVGLSKEDYQAAGDRVPTTIYAPSVRVTKTIGRCVVGGGPAMKENSDGRREWHGPCPKCHMMTLLPTSVEKPCEVRCCWCLGEFTAAEFFVAQNAGGWWTAAEAVRIGALTSGEPRD